MSPTTTRRTRPGPLAALSGALVLLSMAGGCSLFEDIDRDLTDSRSDSRSNDTDAPRESGDRGSSQRRASERPSQGTERHTASFDNQTRWAWIVSLHSGSESELGTGLGNRQSGDRVLIGPGQARSAGVRRQPRWVLTTREEPDEIVRVRVEQRRESWADKRVYWFEILGPVPERMTIGLSAEGDAPTLSGAMPPSPIAAVPVERYPREDR